jgi:hypothetical protein
VTPSRVAAFVHHSIADGGELTGLQIAGVVGIVIVGVVLVVYFFDRWWRP